MNQRQNRRSTSTLRALCFALVTLVTCPAFAQNANEVLAQFDDEPTVLEVQTAALAYAGLHADRLESWYSRANVAYVMPEVAEYKIRIDDDFRDTERFTEDLTPLNEGLGSETRLEKRSQFDIQHEARLRWDFSRLVFNPDVLRVAREVGRQTKARDDVLTTITKLYYERRRAQIDLILNPPSDAAGRIRKDLRIQELTADLDALTGAWYSSELRRAGHNPY